MLVHHHHPHLGGLTGDSSRAEFVGAARWVRQFMDIAEPDPTPPESPHPPAPHASSDEREAAEALVDEAAADIDARDPDAPERIAELAEEAGDLGLPAEPDRVGPPPGDRSGG